MTALPIDAIEECLNDFAHGYTPASGAKINKATAQLSALKAENEELRQNLVQLTAALNQATDYHLLQQNQFAKAKDTKMEKLCTAILKLITEQGTL